ncbi:MAG: hypothetical protein ACRD2G_08555 [Terriglobia bacterium]
MDKRHDLILKAAHLLRLSLDSVRLILKGEVLGPSGNYDRVREQVEALGLADCNKEETILGKTFSVSGKDMAVECVVDCGAVEE